MKIKPNFLQFMYLRQQLRLFLFLILVWKLFVFRLTISSVDIGIQVWQCWYWYRVIFAIDVITVGVCDCAVAISMSINISINIIRVCYQMMEITKLCVVFRFVCIKIHVFYNSIDMIPIIDSLWAVIKHNIFLFLL